MSAASSVEGGVSWAKAHGADISALVEANASKTERPEISFMTIPNDSDLWSWTATAAKRRPGPGRRKKQLWRSLKSSPSEMCSSQGQGVKARLCTRRLGGAEAEWSVANLSYQRRRATAGSGRRFAAKKARSLWNAPLMSLRFALDQGRP
jgi:hypothetical protein